MRWVVIELSLSATAERFVILLKNKKQKQLSYTNRSDCFTRKTANFLVHLMYRCVWQHFDNRREQANKHGLVLITWKLCFEPALLQWPQSGAGKARLFLGWWNFWSGWSRPSFRDTRRHQRGRTYLIWMLKAKALRFGKNLSLVFG